MILTLSQEDRTELLKAWRTGVLDTDKVKALEPFKPARRLTPEEAAEYVRKLDKDS